MADETEVSRSSDNEEPVELESWKSPLGADIDRRKAELEAMPGYRLKLDMDALGRAGHVMRRNAEELSNHATKYLTGGRYSREMDDEFVNELVRHLHNYLTSLYSLIEAQRVVMRHCWGENSDFEKGEYTSHRKASFETGEAEFMTELRNYCTHRSIPLPQISTTLSGGAGKPALLINRLTLDRDTLLKWEKWTAPAKAYLRAKEQHFDLGPVIESYVNTAANYFNWFVKEIHDRNADDVNAYANKAEAFVEWYREETGMNTPGFKRLFPDADTRPGNRAQRRGQQRPQPKRSSKRKRNGR